MAKLEIKDFESGNITEGFDKSRLKPIDFWDKWIDVIDENGETIRVMTVDFNPKDLEELWKK